MSFTKEVDKFLEKHSIIDFIDSEEAKNLCVNASKNLKVDLGLMSSFGDEWHVVDIDVWWANFNKFKVYFTDISSNAELYVFFNSHPKNRLIKVNLSKLINLMDDDDFYHKIFVFDDNLENALFDDHSGFFCGLGYFADAIKQYS